ncbi:hypothetical protein CU098_009312 [Rhizopus stolonifer]|uniref:Uncharacterized protein n=1 Tax=Rhizopus stolonifer TaxID=4846 RepID=A0A367JC07_RHIST|nr:hypothetical protein CU098_009312 [Rhizopus stolonifer]
MKSHQRNHAVSLSKLDNNNNNKSIAICSTHQQHILSFQSNKKPVMNKSPIVKLKERIETLKKTNIESQSIIEQQEREIERLRGKISEDMVRSLEIKTKETDHRKEIHELNLKLKRQDLDYHKRLGFLKDAIEEKERRVVQKQELYERLKEKHKLEISQLISTHQEHIHLLELRHRKEPKQLNIPKGEIGDILERVLIDFEQEEHDIKSDQIIPEMTSHWVNDDMFTVNQQWYMKKYMPIEAESWPFPQTASNTKSRLGI